MRIVAVYGAVFLGVLPGVLWTTGLHLDRLTSLPPVAALGRWAGGALLAGGIAGLTATVSVLATRGRGWPISHLPPRRLVIRGPYRLLRHPLYFCFVAGFVGLGLAAGSWGVALGSAGLLAAGASIYALAFEEPRLRARFGRAWDAYRREVPGVVPLRLPAGRAADAAIRAWRRAVPALERLAARTVLFRLGHSVWVTYGAFTAAGTAVMALWLSGLTSASGVSTGRLTLFVTGLAAAALVGARLAWLAYRWRDLVREPVPTLRTVGFVSWGSLAGLLVYTWGCAVAAGLAPLWLLDRVLLATVPCMAIGRIGCLTYGCCYGRPSRAGVRWRGADAKAVRERGAARGAVPRTPTQILESLGVAAILVPAVALTTTPVPSGTVASVIVVLYGLVRFGVDCLRDERRFGPWRLTAGQVAGALAVAAGWVAFFLVDGPAGWDRPATRLARSDLLRGLPATVSASLVVFTVCGFHWREVGRW